MSAKVCDNTVRLVFHDEFSEIDPIDFLSVFDYEIVTLTAHQILSYTHLVRGDGESPVAAYARVDWGEVFSVAPSVYADHLVVDSVQVFPVPCRESQAARGEFPS